MARKYPTAQSYLGQPKVAAIVKALRSKRGATIEELAAGRQAHSLRAILSRLRTIAGLNVTHSENPKRGRVYRVSPKKGGR